MFFECLRKRKDITVANRESDVLITAVYHGVEANPVPFYVKIQGLDDGKQYQLLYMHSECEPKIMSGVALRNAGICINAAKEEFESYQIYIKEVMQS